MRTTKHHSFPLKYGLNKMRCDYNELYRKFPAIIDPNLVFQIYMKETM